MIQNPLHQALYNSFSSTYSREESMRIKDLRHLSSLNSSFIIYSDCRNGATTLMNNLAKRTGATYVDASDLIKGKEIEQLKSLLNERNNHLLLDEASYFLRRLEILAQPLDYFIQTTVTARLGLRLHQSHYSLKEWFLKQNFEIIELGKIPYEDFKNGCKKEFQKVNFFLDSKYIEHAHENYANLAESIWFIGETIRVVAEEEREPSFFEIDKNIREKYIWFELKTR